MFEFFKLCWDFFVLRDAARKGRLNWRVVFIAVGFVLFLYGTGLPITLLYVAHPKYKPLFVATLVVDGMVFVWFMIWGVRRYFRRTANEKPG